MLETLVKNVIDWGLEGFSVDLFLGLYVTSKRSKFTFKQRVGYTVRHRAFQPMVLFWICKWLVAHTPVWVGYGALVGTIVYLLFFHSFKRLIGQLKAKREQRKKEQYFKWLDEYFNRAG